MEPRDQANLEGYSHQGQWRTAARGALLVLHHVQDFQNNPQGKHCLDVPIKDRIREAPTTADHKRNRVRTFLIFETDFYAG